MAQRINRVHEALVAWKKMEEKNVNLFPPDVMADPDYAKLRLKYLDEITAKLSVSPTREEKDSLRILAVERKKLFQIAFPGKQALNKILFRMLRPFKSFMARKAEQVRQNQQLARIQTSMQKAGFGEYVAKVFAKIRQGERNFSLPTSVCNHYNEQVYHNLKFAYDEACGHSFDSFQTNYRNALSPGIYKNQTFSVNETSMNSKRAENLIAGRAILESVSENGQIVQQWVKLDTKKDEQGNFLMKNIPTDTFDVHAHCQQQLPFWKNVNPYEQLRVVGNLMVGNRSALNIDYQGNPLRVQIEADPENRMMKVFDEKGKPVDLKKLGAKPTQKIVGKQLDQKAAQSQSKGRATSFKSTQQKPSTSKQEVSKNQARREKKTNRKKTKLSH